MNDFKSHYKYSIYNAFTNWCHVGGLPVQIFLEANPLTNAKFHGTVPGNITRSVQQQTQGRFAVAASAP